MPRKKNATPTAAQKAEIITYKGFDRDLKCLGFQYEIGKTYTHDGEVVRCAAGGFHSCENPLDTWSYYAPNASRFAEVVASGQIDRDEGGDSKIASAEITIRAELKLPGIIKRAAYWLTEMIAATTGDYAHAATTGYRAHAATTGNGAIASALGIQGTAKAGDGGWIVLAAWEWTGERHKLLTVKAARVGGPEGIQADVSYRLNDSGEFERAEEEGV